MRKIWRMNRLVGLMVAVVVVVMEVVVEEAVYPMVLPVGVVQVVGAEVVADLVPVHSKRETEALVAHSVIEILSIPGMQTPLEP